MREIRQNHSKYRRLWTWLIEQPPESVNLKFVEVEAILGFTLPPFARRQSSAWQSHKGSALGQAIHDAGWRVRETNLVAEMVAMEPDRMVLQAVEYDPSVLERLHHMKSSLISSASFDQRQSAVDVTLRDGTIYRFEDVPPDVFVAWVNASSPGRFFLKHIKDRYTSRRR